MLSKEYQQSKKCDKGHRLVLECSPITNPPLPQEYETQRQIALLESGHEVRQETRYFDSASGTTIRARSKEDEVDYRYLFIFVGSAATTHLFCTQVFS